MALSKSQITAAAVSVAIGLWLFGSARQISESQLQARVAEIFPVRAANYVKTQMLPGPLFNDYDWGGFLLWSLPGLPVAIDGRLNLFGDAGLERSLNTWRGSPGWDSDPALLAAKLIIAKKQATLTTLLRNDERFKIVHEDDIALVFVASR